MQVVKPLYSDSLNAWVGHLPDDVEAEIETIAPMLGVMGYSYSPNPYYGKPDQEVTDKYNAWLKTNGDKEVKNAPELTEGTVLVL